MPLAATSIVVLIVGSLISCNVGVVAAHGAKVRGQMVARGGGGGKGG